MSTRIVFETMRCRKIVCKTSSGKHNRVTERIGGNRFDGGSDEVGYRSMISVSMIDIFDKTNVGFPGKQTVWRGNDGGP